jgi:hypothetical protein
MYAPNSTYTTVQLYSMLKVFCNDPWSNRWGHGELDQLVSWPGNVGHSYLMNIFVVYVIKYVHADMPEIHNRVSTFARNEIKSLCAYYQEFYYIYELLFLVYFYFPGTCLICLMLSMARYSYVFTLAKGFCHKVCYYIDIVKLSRWIGLIISNCI